MCKVTTFFLENNNLFRYFLFSSSKKGLSTNNKKDCQQPVIQKRSITYHKILSLEINMHDLHTHMIDQGADGTLYIIRCNSTIRLFAYLMPHKVHFPFSHTIILKPSALPRKSLTVLLKMYCFTTWDRQASNLNHFAARYQPYYRSKWLRLQGKVTEMNASFG